MDGLHCMETISPHPPVPVIKTYSWFWKYSSFPRTFDKVHPNFSFALKALGKKNKWWHCELRKSSLNWQVQLNCFIRDTWAKMWALNSLIFLLSALLTFLSLFQTCDVASGGLSPVCPVQETTGDWRGPREGPQGGSTWEQRELWEFFSIPWSGGEVDVVLFLSSLHQWRS